MYRTVLSVALASIFSTASISAVAADQVKGFYVGAGYGVVKLPSERELDFSNPKNGSIDFGYSFSENWAVEAQLSQSVTEGMTSMGESIDITYETRSSLVSEQGFNYTQAMQAVNSASVDFAVRADISVDTYGIYGVYRTAGPLYAKIKAGVLSVETSADLSVTEATVTVVDASNITSTFPFDRAQLSAVEEAADLSTISETETEFSIGVGAGYKFSDKFAVELEFTRLSSDFDSYSLSAKYHF